MPRTTNAAALVLAASILEAAACLGPKRTALDPPAGVDLLALIETSADGKLLEGTGLVAWDPLQGITIYSSSGASAIAVGYARASLNALGGPSPAEMAADRLTEPKGCEERLPPPLFAARVDAEGSIQKIDPARIPPLTTGWIRNSCPDVAPERLSFDFSCLRFRCPARVVQTSHCTYQVSLDCPTRAFSATLGSGGELCLNFGPSPSQSQGQSNSTCEARPPEEPAVASYQCASPISCRIDAYVAPKDAPFDLARIQVLDVPKYSPPQGLTGGTPQLPKPARFIGYLYDLALTEHAAVVSAGPGVPIEFCFGTFSGKLLRYDQETLELTHTATVPTCLTLLASDPTRPPSEEGLIGVFLDGDRLFLGRLDAFGRFLSEKPLDPRDASAIPPGDPPPVKAACNRATGLLVLPQISRLLIVLDLNGPEELCGGRASQLLVFDLATLSPIGPPMILPGDDIYAIAAADDRTVVLGDSGHIKVAWFDVASSTVRSSITLPQDIARNDTFVPDVRYVPPPIDAVLMSVGRNNPSLYRVREIGGIGPRAIDFEVESGPVGVIRWPPSADLMLVEGTSRASEGDWPAYVSLYDATRARYLPGARNVGHGAAGRSILEDGRGRIWFILPWEATALRLTPKPR